MHSLSKNDSSFLRYIKALSIIVIVFGHSGGFWAFKPYTEFLHVVIPIFFFMSGAVTFYSYNRSKSIASYYKKRIIGLYVPYFLLCSIALIYFVFMEKRLPDVTLQKLFQWSILNPHRELTPFSIGHIWFLQTLLIITITSPILFFLNTKHHLLSIVTLFILLAVSLAQIPFDFDGAMEMYGINFYKPLIHSAFYLFGALYFSRYKEYGTWFPFSLFSISLLLCIGTYTGYSLNPDYEYHTYAPDFYYVSGSFAAIFFVLMIQRVVICIVESTSLSHQLMLFFDRHVFAVYLLHPLFIMLFIYLFEEDTGRVSVGQGLLRFTVALTASAMCAVPFSNISQYLTKRMLGN